MGLRIEQLKALFVKDWLIRKRHWIVTIFELFLPALLTLSLLKSLPFSDSKGSQFQVTDTRQSNVFNSYAGEFTCYLIGDEAVYTPVTSEINLFMDSVNRGCDIKVLPFLNEDSMLSNLSLGYVKGEGLIFHSFDLTQRKINYSILMSSVTYNGPWNRMSDHFDVSNFHSLQSAINLMFASYPSTDPNGLQFSYTDKLFIKEQDDNPMNRPNQTDPVNTNGTAIVTKMSKIDFFLTYFYLEISFLFIVAIMTRRIVKEKSTNAKEFLRIMGMSNDVYWISHFINYFTLSIFHALTITILFESYAKVNPFGNWSPTLFIIIYLMTSVSAIMMTFVISIIISKPVVAVLVAIALRAVCAYVPILSSSSNASTLYISNKIMSCLLPDGGLLWSLYHMAVLGNANKSVWSYFFSSTRILQDIIPTGYVFLMMIFSWLVLGFLVWYLDAVWPWQPGTTKPWNFPLRMIFSKTSEENQVIDLESYTNSGLNESNTIQTEVGIRCINLQRSFGSFGSKKRVVDGVNLDILKGQITVLLGHNGAGKTTTMNMITGILPPTAGTVLVNGIDVRKDVFKARQALALCPQVDLLFDELTVNENLYLCAGLRGLSKSKKRELVPMNISRVNLTQKENTLASRLSGGMKRRLQLALALTTSSEILILDEPTSGLDPESRRQLWNLLLELRKNLTILLTTHFMEEADALGDRIVIMDSGRIKCSGSPMFLKSRLGAGYLVRIAKSQEKFNSEATESLIDSYFPNAAILGDTKEEILFGLDKKDSNLITSKNLPDLCDRLDEMKETLGIITYGINVSTLEDVFLRVCLAETELNPIAKSNAINTEDSMIDINQILTYTTLTGFALKYQRLKGLIFKRFHYTKRHKKMLLFTTLLPVIAIIYTISSTLNADALVKKLGDEHFDPIRLNASAIYGNIVAVVLTNSTIGLNPFLQVYRNVNNEKGIDTKIIDSSLSFQEYLDQNNEDEKTFFRKYLFGVIESGGKMKLWFNPEATLGLQMSIDAYADALVRLKSGQQNSRITTTYEKIPSLSISEILLRKLLVTSYVAVFIPFGLCFISASYFLFPSTEYNLKVALVQKMNGIEPLLFWAGHFMFDALYHSIISFMIVTAICYVDPYILWKIRYLGTFLLLLLLFGLASIPFAYLLSYLPVSPDSGFALIIVTSIISTMVGSVLYFIFTMRASLSNLRALTGFLFPPFATTTAIATLYSNRISASDCEVAGRCKFSLYPSGCCSQEMLNKYLDPFDKDYGIRRQIIVLAVSPLIYFALLIAFDMNIQRLGYLYEFIVSRFNSRKDNLTSLDDDDVAIERERVEALLKKQDYRDTLIVRDLVKDFNDFRAVDNLNFTVHQKECFGLLGVNGAGKTTTFRMLTGDLLVTSGDAFIHKISLRQNLKKFQQMISYCPQYDALLANLNPRETLALFARLRGMPEPKVKANVDFMIKSTDLTKFASTLNSDLSGGNKRKLSLAIASIARPELMFLDEPTTGVDPASRRKIWSTLIHLRDFSGSSIVLTSHSMDECETLCSRIGIMARGKLKCLGSAQYLKEKFGQGFSLLIKMGHEINKEPEKIEEIKSYVMENFPSCFLRDQHHTILHYHITDTSARWGDMLRRLEDAKLILPIDDYTLTGTTLEQVFLSFAKKN